MGKKRGEKVFYPPKRERQEAVMTPNGIDLTLAEDERQRKPNVFLVIASVLYIAFGVLALCQVAHNSAQYGWRMDYGDYLTGLYGATTAGRMVVMLKAADLVTIAVALYQIAVACLCFARKYTVARYANFVLMAFGLLALILNTFAIMMLPMDVYPMVVFTHPTVIVGLFFVIGSLQIMTYRDMVAMSTPGRRR